MYFGFQTWWDRQENRTSFKRSSRRKNEERMSWRQCPWWTALLNTILVLVPPYFPNSASFHDFISNPTNKEESAFSSFHSRKTEVPVGGVPFTSLFPTSSQLVERTVPGGSDWSYETIWENEIPPLSVNDLTIAFFCSSEPFLKISCSNKIRTKGKGDPCVRKGIWQWASRRREGKKWFLFQRDIYLEDLLKGSITFQLLFRFIFQNRIPVLFVEWRRFFNRLTMEKKCPRGVWERKSQQEHRAKRRWNKKKREK